MEEIKIKKLGISIFKETLDNGLEIYIYKRAGFQKKYAFFETKYGAINNEFIPNGKKEYRRYPLGIAHFLEHKLFESNEDEKIFTFFEKNGAAVNAATGYERTYYYFNTVDNFDECLNKLIDFVQSPYFTDENVEKEKGIIGQEIDMRNDRPEGFLYRKLNYNLLKESQYRFDIAGSRDDIDKITKEDLYDCYNTFYHPSNMFLVIAGDVDVEKTIQLVKENQGKKKFNKQTKIIQKEYIESDEIVKKEEKFIHNVSSRKVGYAYKMNFDKKSDSEKFLFSRYLIIFFRILFGDISDFEENLVKEGVIKSFLDWDYEIFNNKNITLEMSFIADTDNEDLLKEKIEEKLKDRKDFDKLFDLCKRSFLSDCINALDYTESVASLIRTVKEQYASILPDYYELLESLNYDDFIKIVDSLEFNKCIKVVLDSKEV